MYKFYVYLTGILVLLLACRPTVTGGERDSPETTSTVPPTLSILPTPSDPTTSSLSHIFFVPFDLRKGTVVRAFPTCEEILKEPEASYVLLVYMPATFNPDKQTTRLQNGSSVLFEFHLIPHKTFFLPGWEIREISVRDLLTRAVSAGTSIQSIQEMRVKTQWEYDGADSGRIGEGEEVVCSSKPQNWDPAVLDLGFPAELTLAQVYLRYDSAQAQGTFAASLCNQGGRVVYSPMTVEIEVNGVKQAIAVQEPILPGMCVEIFPKEATFADFGVKAPGQVPVTVRLIPSSTNDRNDFLIEKQTLLETLDVPQVSTQPDSESQHVYESCLQQREGVDFPVCETLLHGIPVSQRNEVAVWYGPYRFVATRPWEAVLGPALAQQRACATGLTDLFQWEFSDGQPWIAFLFTHEGRLEGSSGIFVFGDVVYYGLTLDDAFSFLVPNAGVAGCSFSVAAHEFTHALVGRKIKKSYFDREGMLHLVTRVPRFLNEGLATWAEYHVKRPHIGDPQCREEGIYYPAIQDSNEGVLVPYIPIMLPEQEREQYLAQQIGEEEAVALAESASYHTGRCFWLYIEEKYGIEAVRKILDGMIAFRKECAPSFLETFVAPVIGREDYPIFAQRFGLPPSASNCDGD